MSPHPAAPPTPPPPLPPARPQRTPDISFFYANHFYPAPVVRTDCDLRRSRHARVRASRQRAAGLRRGQRPGGSVHGGEGAPAPRAPPLRRRRCLPRLPPRRAPAPAPRADDRPARPAAHLPQLLKRYGEAVWVDVLVRGRDRRRPRPQTRRAGRAAQCPGAQRVAPLTPAAARPSPPGPAAHAVWPGALGRRTRPRRHQGAGARAGGAGTSSRAPHTRGKPGEPRASPAPCPARHGTSRPPVPPLAVRT
jgi:hypothetical protein